MGAWLCYDCEGSEVLVGELLRGACRPEVLSFHVDFISYLEIWHLWDLDSTSALRSSLSRGIHGVWTGQRYILVLG
jgi:hypothetical protein